MGRQTGEIDSSSFAHSLPFPFTFPFHSVVSNKNVGDTTQHFGAYRLVRFPIRVRDCLRVTGLTQEPDLGQSSARSVPPEIELGRD